MGLVILLLEGLAVTAALAVLYTAWLLTHPPRRTYASAVARSRPGDPGELSPRLGYESWNLRSRGFDLPVWDVRGSLPAGAGPTVVLTHGWGDSRVGALSRVAAIAPFAARIVAWDMAGHGEAPGRCTLGTREVEDLLALIERVREPGVALVLFGWSLGAGVSIAAAARLGPGAVAAVIAEAPYRVAVTPARNVLKLRSLPYRWNLPPAMWAVGTAGGVGPNFTGFDRGMLAAKLSCPLLVIHGAEDDVCPIEDGREIAAAAPGARLLEIEGAGHSGLWTDTATLRVCSAEVAQFLKSAGV